MAKQKENVKSKHNIFKTAAISGIILVVLYILGIIFSSALQNNIQILSIWSIIQSILILIFTLVLMSGFYSLGKKYDRKFLKIVVIFGMLFILISFLVSLFVISPTLSNISASIVQKSAELGLNAASDSSVIQTVWQELFADNHFMAEIILVLSLFLVYVFFFILLSILFGVALIKLRDKVKYARVAGILQIVGGATTIIFIGLFVLLIAFVYELIILFNESKK